METSNHSFPCIVCRQPLTEPWLLSCRDLYLGTPHIVDYRVCSSCQLVQQAPIPVETGAFYPDSYPMHHSRGRLYFFARKVMILGVYFDPGVSSKDQVLMDFGCGDGSYLESIQGKITRRIGFEASSHQADQLRARLGCEVHSDVSEAVSALGGSIDVVTAHFVLEHLTDLHVAFGFWRDLLKPGGLVHLAVPNIRSWEARLFGKKWHGLDAPRHISFPDENSLSLLAERHGFQLISQRHGVFPNTWAASLATLVKGRYQHQLFLALVPIGFLLACLFPQSTAVFQLRKT